MGSHKITTEEFVRRARKVHGSNYDYSVTEYLGAGKQVFIKCKIHGAFSQRASSHITGKGCIKCSRNTLSSPEAFRRKARKIHGNKYDYSKAKYETQSGNVILGCKVHGDFSVRANLHLVGRGCQKCSFSLTQDDFLKRANLAHGNAYSYAKTDYQHINQLVVITCKRHGDFEQTPNNHLKGHGCQVCGHRKNNNYAKVGYKLGKRTVQVQGYEPYALAHLVDVEGISPDRIRVGDDVPVIKYFDAKEGKVRRHYPDIFIPSKNTLVEVKSPYLFLKGLRSLKLKRKGAKAVGYKYRVCVISKETKHKITLPKGWYKMTTTQLKAALV